MKHKILFLAAAIIMLAAPVYGQYQKKSVTILDELGDVVTNITSLTILDAGTSDNSTVFGDRNGNVSVTNPITTSSNNSTFLQSQGLVSFWTRAASYKITITDGTFTKTFDNRTGSDTRIPFFASYIGESSSLSLGDDDDLKFGDSDDWTLTWTTGTTSLDAAPASDDGAWNMGSTSKTSDFNLFGGTSGRDLYWDASENTLEFLDDAVLAIGTGDDLIWTHSTGTTTATGAWSQVGQITISASDFLFDDTYDVKWDTSRDQLHFMDNAVLGIGGIADAAGDVTYSWDTSNLLIESATEDTGEIRYGSTSAIDVAHYGNTNSNIAKFNANTSTLEFNGYDLQIQDGDFLMFGDGDDFTFDSTTTKILTVLSAETDESGLINYGADQLGFDSKFFGATASTFVVFDAGADEMIFDLADLKISQGSQVEFIDVTDSLTDWTIDMSTDEVLLFLPTETTDDQSLNIGNAANTSDFRLFGLGATTIIFDASGDEVRFNGYDVGLNDDDVLMFGDANEVTMNFDEDGLDDLQVKGPVIFETTYVEFRTNPVTIQNDGTATGVATGNTNHMVADGTNFEYFILGAGQTIALPFINTVGLNIRLDEGDNEGIEMGEGVTSRSPSAFVIGTDAMYLKVQFQIETVANMDIMAVGFRLAGAYNADLYAYDTYAGINVNNGTVNGIDELNGASANETSLTETWTDGQIYTLEVKIDAAKAVTQYISTQGAGNRGTSAVTAPLAFTWTDTDTVVPFIHILGDATAGCEINLLSYECGLQ